MSFSAFNTTEIQSGNPVTNDLWSKAKTNFDDHESRISTLESGAHSYPPIVFQLRGGFAVRAMPSLDISRIRIFSNITLTGAVIYIPKAGSSGTAQCDVQFKRAAGAFTSIFLTQPSVVYTAGDGGVSSNGSLSTVALLTGDFLRLDITTAQTGNYEMFLYLTWGPT